MSSKPSSSRGGGRPDDHDMRRLNIAGMMRCRAGRDQVVDVGRRYGTQGGQLCRRLLLVEQVERPIADGSTLQMRVVSSGAVERHG
jgi:hypothetical protein